MTSTHESAFKQHLAGAPRLTETTSEVEQDVLAAVRIGDRDRALTLLMEAHGKAVYRYCWAMVRQQEVAQDTHQTVFLPGI